MHRRCFYTVLIDAYCKLDGWSFKAVVSGMPCLWAFATWQQVQRLLKSLCENRQKSILFQKEVPSSTINTNRYNNILWCLSAALNLFAQQSSQSAAVFHLCWIAPNEDVFLNELLGQMLPSVTPVHIFKFGKVVQDWSQLRFHPLELKKMNLFTALRLFFPLL